MKKIVVLISGSGSNLQAILDACHPDGDLSNTQVMAVISNQQNAYGLQRAKKQGIPTHTFPHQGFNRETYDKQLMACIDDYSPDAIILAGFMRILSSTFVQQYEGKLLNIHPSLLPKYTGLNTHQRAIDANDTEHGATVHFVIDELDAGPSIAQIKIALKSNDTEHTLQQRLIAEEHKLYPKAISWVLNQKVIFSKNGCQWQGEYPNQLNNIIISAKKNAA
jgi:phosphoribosylglycinamide formyltransferase-1